ncbi:MAG: epoxyqueuosine reductase [Candidatus Helarchaeota archaeon]|nr:epoxyqueuosine reductase [Candidatus Helarchaeota archaeon]
MEALKTKVKQKGYEIGMDFVGITDLSRLKNTPKRFRATDYLPSARSVIVVGCHFPDGIVENWTKTPSSYQYYGYALINKELGRACFHIAKLVEQAGHRCFPIVPTGHAKDMDHIKQMGEFSHRHAAVAAGLGEFGYNRLVLTPQFGNRVRFCSIITEAPFSPDPMYDGPSLCDRCKKCIEACPGNCLDESQLLTCTIGDKTYEYVTLYQLRCFYNLLGLGPSTGGYSDIPLPKKKGELSQFGFLKRFVKAIIRNLPKFLYVRLQQVAVDYYDYCGRCLHVCDRPTNRFKTK